LWHRATLMVSPHQIVPLLSNPGSQWRKIFSYPV